MEKLLDIELKHAFEKKIQEHKNTITELRNTYGNEKIADVTVNHLFRGARGTILVYTPTSHVDPNVGVLYRGKPLVKVNKQLPKLNNATFPSAEALWWYLLVDEVPTVSQVENLRKDLHMYSNVPPNVFAAIDGLPLNTRPMTRLCTGILALATTSTFQARYDKGLLRKKDYWRCTFDDTFYLLAGINTMAAYIYRKYCKKADVIEPYQNLDWVGNLAIMMGFADQEVHEIFRLLIFTHMDHSASNVSAHTAHTVGSALANTYYTATASMLGLSGPLHGHANEQTLVWLLRMQREAQEQGLSEPDKDFITKYVHDTLEAGRVIPGYGHAALRVEDPRFSMFYTLAEQKGFNTPLLRIVKNLYQIVPGILSNIERISNPFPNMDAITGSCLYSVGVKEHNFYIVLFGLSRLFGLLSQNIIDRSIGQPIFRPTTMSLDLLQKQFTQNTKNNKTEPLHPSKP